MLKKIYIIAGENSGDVLGAAYITSMRDIYGENLMFRGVGGAEMQGLGVDTFMNASALSYFGIVEVVRHLPTILRQRRAILADIKAYKPDLLLTVDLPDLSFSVGRKAKKMGIPVVHINAPTVWAWRPGRAKKIAGFLDGLICLFPFEPPYFQKHGLNAHFLGHPIASKPRHDPKLFRLHHKLGDAPCVCVLPGSRLSEINALSQTLIPCVRQIMTEYPDVHILLPVAAGHEAHIRGVFHSLQHDYGDRFTFVEPRQRYDAMCASECAIAASGTVTLELGVCETPMVVVYRVHELTYWLTRLLVKTHYAALPNILLNAPIVQELIQHALTPETLFKEVTKLLTDGAYRTSMKDKLRQLRPRLTVSPEKYGMRMQAIFDPLLTSGNENEGLQK